MTILKTVLFCLLCFGMFVGCVFLAMFLLMCGITLAQ